MAKAAIVILADTESKEGSGRVANALTTATRVEVEASLGVGCDLGVLLLDRLSQYFYVKLSIFE